MRGLVKANKSSRPIFHEICKGFGKAAADTGFSENNIPAFWSDQLGKARPYMIEAAKAERRVEHTFKAPAKRK
jgi:hypothetical protein